MLWFPFSELFKVLALYPAILGSLIAVSNLVYKFRLVAFFIFMIISYFQRVSIYLAEPTTINYTATKLQPSSYSLLPSQTMCLVDDNSTTPHIRTPMINSDSPLTSLVIFRSEYSLTSSNEFYMKNPIESTSASFLPTYNVQRFRNIFDSVRRTGLHECLALALCEWHCDQNIFPSFGPPARLFTTLVNTLDQLTPAPDDTAFYLAAKRYGQRFAGSNVPNGRAMCHTRYYCPLDRRQFLNILYEFKGHH